MLADDTGHRAVPLWLRVSKELWRLLDRPGKDAVMAGVLQETAVRLLHAAGVAVTAVDIERPARMCQSCARTRPRRGSGWPRPPGPGIPW